MRYPLLLLLLSFLSFSSFRPPLVEYYWVGGSGNWSDLNHWVTSSGGTVLHTQLPSASGGDVVYFDANSFTAAGQTVTLDVNADMRGMSWAGVTNSPTFTYINNASLRIDGSIELAANATYNLGVVIFNLSTGVYSITSNGNNFGTASEIRFNGSAEWVLADALEAKIINFNNGTLSTNNNNITCTYFNITNALTRTLNLGSSTITATAGWYVNGSNITINAGTSTIVTKDFYADITGAGSFTYYNLNIIGGGGYSKMYNSSTFNQISFQPGITTTLQAGATFTANSIIANGTKFDQITLKSTTAGTNATFNVASGTINGTNLILTDIHAIGGATFNADQSIDNGNNTGWNFTSPVANYYWIGNSGNWSDPAHWATTSGGSTIHGDYPYQLDNVFFDANSFSLAGQKVTVDLADAYCNNMDWTGVTNQPEIYSPYGKRITVSGSTTFNAGVTKNIFAMTINTSNPGTTLTYGATGQVTSLSFKGTGELTLQDSLFSFFFYLYGGTMNLNNQPVNAANFKIFATNTTVLNMGSSHLYLGSWEIINSANTTLNSGTSIIEASGNFAGKGYAYNNLIIDGTSTITGANTFTNFTAKPGSNIALEAGVTQTINGNLSLIGTTSGSINISSSTNGVQGIFSKSSGTISAEYLVLKDNQATGGATFNTTNTLDNGNNTGWNITGLTGTDYFWVGGTGNWSDFANHWATTSGGTTFYTSEPGVLDNVFFDANSFSADNQSVTIDLPEISFTNMDWTGIANRVSLLGSTKIMNIYGSLTLHPNATVSVRDFNFLSEGTEVISTSNSIWNNAYFYFKGNGVWNLQDSLSVMSFVIENGTFNSNNNGISVSLSFEQATSNPKTVNLGTSTLFARGFRLDVGSNIVFNGANATIIASSVFNPGQESGLNNVTLNNVKFIPYHPVDIAALNESFSCNTLELSPGITLKIGATKTITIADLIANGTEADSITIISKTTVPGIFSMPSGTVNGNYLIIENNSATGGATFNATNSVNKGNVSGWIFSQTITFNPLTDKIYGDSPFDLTATATSGLAVSYSSSDTTVATISGSTVTITGAGTTTITASQAGNTGYYAASDILQTLTVLKVAQTITFGALADKTYGDTDFQLTATASSGLSVSYTSSDTTVATISGSTVTIVGAGATTITASQSGDINYNAATAVDQVLTVLKSAQTITFGALADKTYGDADFQLTATASSGLSVSYRSSDTTVATISGSTVTIVGSGATTITASQSGNTNYNAATAVDQVLTVLKVAQTITFGALADKTYGDADFQLTATASSGLSVSYMSSDITVATISGSTVTIVGTGTTTITASQGGNTNYNAATAIDQGLTVLKSAQTITFGALADKTYGDTDFQLTATASSGLSVSYTSYDTTVATISGSTVTIVGSGATTITASQSGNTNYNAAIAVDQVLTVLKVAQTITFNTIEDQIFEDGSLTLNATASSGLEVTYEIVSGPATLSGNVVTFTDLGIVIVSAFQAGNDVFFAATSVEQSFDIVTITGIEMKPTNVVQIYPNPATNFVHIPYSYSALRILDTNGRVVYQVNDGRNKIDVSTLLAGSYIVITFNKNGIGKHKLLKK